MKSHFVGLRTKERMQKYLYKAFSKYVIVRNRLQNNQVKEVVFLIVHARVPIPRKGSACLRLFVAIAELQVVDI